jgi:hypothetical protein
MYNCKILLNKITNFEVLKTINLIKNTYELFTF